MNQALATIIAEAVDGKGAGCASFHTALASLVDGCWMSTCCRHHVFMGLVYSVYIYNYMKIYVCVHVYGMCICIYAYFMCIYYVYIICLCNCICICIYIYMYMYKARRCNFDDFDGLEISSAFRCVLNHPVGMGSHLTRCRPRLGIQLLVTPSCKRID